MHALTLHWRYVALLLAALAAALLMVTRSADAAKLEDLCEIPSTITDGQRVTLSLKRPHFNTANNVHEAADREFGPGSALSLTPGAT